MLLSQGKAAVFRQYPFTLILKQEVSRPAVVETKHGRSLLRIKIDPGAKTTGLAVVNDATGEVVWVAELQHRGFQIRDALTSRRQLRRSRRNRKTRYRKPRFLNRTRPKGWLPPSLNSRVANILTWVKRLSALCRITAISQELVKFDTQQMEDSEISGVGYQQGTLAGYEIREFLLEKWKRTCAYCGAKDTNLEIEHINPRSKGGSIRYCKRTKFHKGFQTGDIVKAVVTSGKKIGRYVGRVATRATGSFNISTPDGLVQGISHKYCTHIHKKDGYSYAA